MGKTKNYFGEQFQPKMFFLNHENASDFYLSSWQNSPSTLPLLCVNTLLFLFSVSILLSCLVMKGTADPRFLSYWIIYLTHWGLLLITCTTGLAFLVSLVAYLKGNIIDATSGLPWYIKAYWTMYNITLPVAMLITILYYSLLKPILTDDMILNTALDVLEHGINSAVVLVLLLVSRVPTRLLHFWQPCACMLLYLAFHIIYYYSGGTDVDGNHAIYPGMNWEEPLVTSVFVVIAAVGFILLHVLLWVFSLLRNYGARKSGFYSEGRSISN